MRAIMKELSGELGPFVIAEIGANHNGDMELCRRLIDSAAGIGASAVKFQSWTAGSLISRSEYERNPNLRAEVERHQLTPGEHRELSDYCGTKGILFCSTPFSAEEVDMLEALDVPFFKVASMDVNNLPFLEYIAAKKRPILLSTGMATLGEIERALDVIVAHGNEQIVLLHCVSLYPPDLDLVNLRNIQMLRDVFGRPVGFSDHTIGVGVPLAAIAVGAAVIEKHFTLDKTMEGWDQSVSADPQEMAVVVAEGRSIFRALGSYRRSVSAEEIEKRATFRTSAVARHAMQAGDVIRQEDLDFKRPGTGIAPDQLQYVVGRRVAVDIGEDEPLLWRHLQ